MQFSKQPCSPLFMSKVCVVMPSCSSCKHDMQFIKQPCNLLFIISVGRV